jgi:DNA-binding transcriptional LysR family regulator
MALEDVASFVTAAELGSLTGAARALGVPKSTISRRLARLEETLGQQLVLRNARVFRLTEAGELLFRRSAPALRDVDEALDAARDAGALPAGDLRITAPVDLGGSAPFASAMVRFAAAWPRLHVTVDLSDRFVDLVAEGVDVGVRLHMGPLEDRATLMARKLRPMAMGLFASRAYLDRAGRPRSLRALGKHELVRIERPGGATPWPLLEGLPDLDARATRGPGVTTTSMSFAAAAVGAGAGIGLLPILIADALPVPVERVLPNLDGPSPTLSLVWPASRQLSPRVRAFVDFMVATFAT